jgi:hypothetical protein
MAKKGKICGAHTRIVLPQTELRWLVMFWVRIIPHAFFFSLLRQDASWGFPFTAHEFFRKKKSEPPWVEGISRLYFLALRRTNVFERQMRKSSCAVKANFTSRNKQKRCASWRTKFAKSPLFLEVALYYTPYQIFAFTAHEFLCAVKPKIGAP